MTEDQVTYSREETIKAVTDYYQFLTTLYLDEDRIEYPPPEGWPSIVHADPATLANFAKSNEVIALLAHLPYIRGTGNYNDASEAACATSFNNWRGLFGVESLELRRTEPFDFQQIDAPHCFSFAVGDDADFYYIMDTELGIMHWENCSYETRARFHRPTIENWSEDEDYGCDCESDCDCDDDQGSDSENNSENNQSTEPEDEKLTLLDWRYGHPAWPIPVFFELLKDQFREQHWIPISTRTVVGPHELPNEEGMVAMLKEIYNQHGWPQHPEVYDKHACITAVKHALLEKYPGSTCVRSGS